MTARALLVALALAGAVASGGVAHAQTPGPGPLDKRISVRFESVDLATALTRLRTVFGVPLAFSSEAIPSGRPVSLTASEESVGYVLGRLLEGTGLRVIPLEGGAVVIARAPEAGPSQLARTPVPAIASGIRELDQIVVMGTPVSGGPEREQTGAVSVVAGEDLKNYHFSRTADLFRAALPGVVLWDQGPSGPPAEVAAVRGASSFTSRGLKTYIDGIEVASPTLVTLIDPRSIERIEVIRGPQGAALYGSDAINGVIQVITKKGTLGESPRVQGSAEVAAGPFDRERVATLLRQDYAGAMAWGGTWASLAGNGSFGRVGTGNTAPNTQSWNAQVGGRMALGSVLLSGIVRGGEFDFTEDVFRTVGISTAPAAATAGQVEVATVGVTAVHAVRDWWIQTFVTGYDRAKGALGSDRDNLLGVRQPLGATHETASRTSFRYSSALTATWQSALSLTTTVGLEYSRLEQSRGGYDTTGAQTSYVRLYRDAVGNTGGFVQGKLRAGQVVLNAGARAERSSAFGADYGTAWAPSLGVSWQRPVGEWALRVRGGWGRGLRPPEPGMSREMATATVRQVGNPNLAPESQSGIEAGIDLYAGTTGYVRATVYDQRASDLIQSVLLPAQVGAPRTFQFQNVGAIRNRGLELEAGLRLGRLGLDGQYYATTSRVERIARSYSGWLRPGDKLPEIPSHSGAARLTYTFPGVHFATGASFLGSWTGYDWTELAEVNAGTRPVKASTRDYLITYPGVVKPYVTVSFDIAGRFLPYLSIENLTNTTSFEQHNGNPPAGRSVLFGIEIRP